MGAEGLGRSERACLTQTHFSRRRPPRQKQKTPSPIRAKIYAGKWPEALVGVVEASKEWVGATVSAASDGVTQIVVVFLKKAVVPALRFWATEGSMKTGVAVGGIVEDDVGLVV